MGSRSQDADGLFVEDFHVRLCALDALFFIHYTQLRHLPLPTWLQKLGQRIKVEYLGHSIRKEALARATVGKSTRPRNALEGFSRTACTPEPPLRGPVS